MYALGVPGCNKNILSNSFPRQMFVTGAGTLVRVIGPPPRVRKMLGRHRSVVGRQSDTSSHTRLLWT